ncbi:MAG: aldose epimerase family protein [Ignavibacteriaceae bacterium]
MLTKILCLFFLSTLIIVKSFSTPLKANEPQAQNREVQMIEKTFYGKLPDGHEVFSFSLKNEAGTQVNIINYGAIVTHLFVKDKDGIAADIVQGYDSLEGYINDQSFFGTIVGRYGNRIDGGKFSLDGNEYQLSVNSNGNHLHGGFTGFYKALWNAEPIESEAGPALKLTLTSPDGDEGYPGTLSMTVIYTLTNDNELKIEYEGTTDKTTILNPTHHSYFNLTGNLNTTILDHELTIDADSYTPVDSTLIPTGELSPVKSTPMDFTKPTLIGLNIDADFQQLKLAGGYDHNWVLNNYEKGKIRKVVSLYEPKTGRVMEVLTDQPGMQFYSGNFLNGNVKGKNGAAYEFRTALCLEAQHYPDSPNQPEFPSVILRPGEIYKQTTIYKFSVK